MFLRLTPIKLKLYAEVTLEVNLLVATMKITLLKKALWEFQTATINKLLIDNTKAEEDKTPPTLQSFGVSNVFYNNQLIIQNRNINLAVSILLSFKKMCFV